MKHNSNPLTWTQKKLRENWRKKTIMKLSKEKPGPEGYRQYFIT